MLGTWIPLQDGKDLAAKNGVLDKLMPIFSFVAGDRSPPPAPKHATSASSKPRAPRAAAQPRKPAANVYAHVQDYKQMDTSMHDGEAPDNETVASESQLGDYEIPQHPNPRKRKAIVDPMTVADREHQLWADELFDYFMLQDDPLDSPSTPPIPPANATIDRPIDERGHTALHWAAAMGDIEVVKDLIRRGASVDVQSKTGETPLMRSVIFTNNFDRRNMEKLAGLLIRTVSMQEWFGSTVFHHIAGVTQSKKKYECARYYMDCIINKMAEVLSSDQIERILNEVDNHGDTAITIAARNGARKCVRSLIGRHAALDIPNAAGETADQLIVQLNHRRQERSHNRQLSSSPFQTDNPYSDHLLSGAAQLPNGSIPFDLLKPHTTLKGAISSQHGMSDRAHEVYKSEAALTMTSQTMPVFFTKLKALASSIDTEMAEKDAELAEAERVVAMRRQEVEALRRQQEELRIREVEQTSGGIQSDDQLTQELAELERECEGLTQGEQDLALKELLAAESQKATSTTANDLTVNGVSDHEVVLREKLVLTRQLLEAQRQREDLVKQIVANLSVAGLGDKQNEYKRLITGALGVREDDVEGMLPEIVAELEEARGMEAMGA